MHESLYDRFRPFKPYDLLLAVFMIMLVVFNSELDLMQRLGSCCGALVLLVILDYAQKFVCFPTPIWQALTIVAINTMLIAFLVHFHGANSFRLAISMLSTAFGTVAFGKIAGLIASGLTIAVLCWLESAKGDQLHSPLDWLLFFAVLSTLVAILDRINRLRQDALFDEVTGLRNHRYFQVRLREELQRSERYGRPTSLVLLDLDNFKRVNDHGGHAEGDRVLHQLGRILVWNARSADIVCRYGGDELAIILAETSLEEALPVVERLRREVEQRCREQEVVITISAGVAVYPNHGRDADSLIAAADAAMYRAKQMGKNRVFMAETLSKT